MSGRNRSGASASQVCRVSSFSNQPPRVLIIDTSPPWWSETRSIVCEALENFLSLASSLEGPSRVPLLSLYAVNMQQECLLPFVVRERLFFFFVFFFRWWYELVSGRWTVGNGTDIHNFILFTYVWNLDCVKSYRPQRLPILSKPRGGQYDDLSHNTVKHSKK